MIHTLQTLEMKLLLISTHGALDKQLGSTILIEFYWIIFNRSMGKLMLSYGTTSMGPLQLMITWYKIHLAGEQATHWDILNKENSIQV